MRVKKLNVNRRQKAGDDDSLAGDDLELRKWTKAHHDEFENSSTCSTSSSSGDSPTRVSRIDEDLHMAHGSHQSSPRYNGSRYPSDQEMRSPEPNKKDDWHSHIDGSVRDGMLTKIVAFLKALKPNAPPKVLEKLPGLAYRMEEHLFKLATSETEYSDQATLPQRLNVIQQTNAQRLLQLQQQASAMSPKTKATTPLNRKALSEEQARVVFQCLQSWRQKLVNIYGVDPWDILPNQVLAKVALYVPTTEQELALCGLQGDCLARFGSSLLQELRTICGNAAKAANSTSPSARQNARTPSPSTKRVTEKPKAVRPAAPRANENASGKKRKAAMIAPSSDPAAMGFTPPTAAQANRSNGAVNFPNLAPSQLLFRPMGMDATSAGSAAMHSVLPTLLPSAAPPVTTNGSNGSAAKFTPTGRPPMIQPQPSASFGREAAADIAQENHMHLLAQGAGRMSKQHESEATKSADMYEKEIYTLRMLLQQSQQEKIQLAAEVQRLRHQLQPTPSSSR